MQCPSCRKTLRGESLYGQVVDRCAACDGLWLDVSELGALLRACPASDAPPTDPKPHVDGLRCPACDQPMTPLNYAYDSGVLINKCPACGGVWLQSGQLQLLAQYRAGTPAVRALGNAFAENMRTSEHWRRVQRVLRSRLLSGLVAAVYIVTAVLTSGSLEPAFRMAIFLPFPLAFIWFPEAWGGFTRISLRLGRPTMTQLPPGDVVAAIGWMLLLLPIALPIVGVPIRWKFS